MKLINSTPNGQVFTCPCQKKVHLEFGNLLLNLSFDELRAFKEYVNSIDFEFYLTKNRNTQNRRKLLLHHGSNNSYFALSVEEYKELKELLSLKQKPNEQKYNIILIENINLN